MRPRGRAGQQNYEESTQRLFFFSLKRKEEVLRERQILGEKEGKALPEFVVAGCGRTAGVHRERETKVTKEEEEEEGEQQFD